MALFYTNTVFLNSWLHVKNTCGDFFKSDDTQATLQTKYIKIPEGGAQGLVLLSSADGSKVQVGFQE